MTYQVKPYVTPVFQKRDLLAAVTAAGSGSVADD